MSYKEIPVNENHLICYQLTAGGEFEFLSEIENVGPGILCTEPHAIVLESGKIIVHFRCQDDAGMLTVYQCESYDGGRSFTKAHRLLSEKGGAPAHIINQNGTLISVYGYRQEPYGIRAMFSNDEGNSWDVDHVIADNGNSADIGYPASVPLQDGSILTVYYDKPEGYSSNVIMQVIWKYSNK